MSKRRFKAAIAKGWQCPVCARVMAPHVTSCERCVGCAPVYVPTPFPIYPPLVSPQIWYTAPLDSASTITYGDVGTPASSGTLTIATAHRVS